MPTYGKNTTDGRLEIVDRFVELGVRDWLPVLPYPNGSLEHHYFNAACLILSGRAGTIDLADETQLREACHVGLDRIRYGDLYAEWKRKIAKIEKEFAARAEQQPTEQANG